MESVINNALVNFLHQNKILKQEQFGFQKGKSCTLQLVDCTQKWVNHIDDKKTVDVIYVDFQKAFDSVVHSKLIFKIRSVISNNFLLSWIHAFLSNRTQLVSVNNVLSNPIEVSSGVPQGSVLGPTLFLLYINDLVDTIKHSQIMLFADDLKIFNLSSKHDLLQSDLNNLSLWSTKWQLPISYEKSNVLYIGNSNPKFKYSLNSHPLDGFETGCKDLGIFMSKNLSFSVHCEKLVSTASKISGMLFRSFVSKDRKLLIKGYKTYVRPILEYSTPVWSPNLCADINSIESVQRRFTKRLLYGSNLSYDNRLKQLNLQRLELRRIHFDAIMCYNIIKQSVLRFNDFYCYSDYGRTRSTNHESLIISTFKSETKRHSFAIRSAYIWNHLPNEVKKAINLHIFRSKIEKVDFSRFLRGRT